MRLLPLVTTAIAAVLASPALAQTAEPQPVSPSAAEPAPAAEDSAPAAESGQIVVIATRIKGQIDAPQKPILTLNEAEIASYGASSLSDLITALSPQTSSGRGRGSGGAVILLNGQRISSFREMRNFTPDAIKRVEVLPEEVALRYGFSANQRVINFILKDNYASVAAEVDYRQPWAGGSSNWEVEGSLLQISGPRRLSLTASTSDTSPLTEAERNIVPSAANIPSVSTDPDPAAFRFLIADSRSYDLNGSWATGLGEGGRAGSFSVNGAASLNYSRGMSGLDLVTLTAPNGSSARRALDDPLERYTRTVSLQGGAGLNLNLADWQLSATLDAARSETQTRIDRRADTSGLVALAAAGTLPITAALPTIGRSGQDEAQTVSSSGASLITLVGRPLRLPAGEVTTTLKAGFGHTAIDSEDSRGAAGITHLSRSDASAGFNIGLPLTSRRDGVLGAVGDISLNFSGGINHLSDFGTLTDWSAGLTWAVTEKLGLQASYIVNQAAPGLSELGAPVIVSYNVPIYDFNRGETVLVTITSGGNRDLRQEVQRDLKFGANWQLPFLANSNLLVEYFRNRSEDVTASFPVLTPAIEAAFPGRVTREASGRLTAVDRRAITFARQDGERLRWGLNLSGTVGKAPSGGPGEGRMGGPRGGGPGGGGPGGGGRPGGPGAGGPRGPGGGGPPMMAMFGGGGQGRWNIGLYHTVRFQEQVLIAPGVPVLDLLNGDALTGGGLARHTVEADAGVFHKGIGVRLSARYNGATRLRSGTAGSTDLNFGALALFDLRMFVDLNQQQWLVKAVPFFKSSRFALRIENLFDARQRVTDATGTVPLSYQPDYLDPRGRFIGVELRKQF